MTERIGASWGQPPSGKQKIVFIPDRFQASEFISQQNTPILPYGYGRSYGDVCLNQAGTLLSSQFLDKLITFDQESGVLSCESGVTIGDLQKFTIPKGWCLPVSPGSQWISVGGAIANDVHGKNHHRQGTFGQHVINLILIRSDGSVFHCNRKQNEDLFTATIGGIGLTGFITQATIQLMRCSSYHLIQEKEKFYSLSEFFDLADEAEQNWSYTVAWLDCVTSQAGRGIFMRANHCTDMLPFKERAILNLPYPLSGNFITRSANRVMANLIFYKNRSHKRSLENYIRFFYPLDRLHNWSKFYGQQGMYQFQCVIPHKYRLEGMLQLLNTIKQSGLGGFLSVLKTFADKQSPGLLSFPMHGVTLAVDFAATEQAQHLIQQLTEQVIEMGGRIYPAKDALMTADSIRAAYPSLNQFLLKRDPGISSDFSRRLLDEE